MFSLPSKFVLLRKMPSFSTKSDLFSSKFILQDNQTLPYTDWPAERCFLSICSRFNEAFFWQISSDQTSDLTQNLED